MAEREEELKSLLMKVKEGGKKEKKKVKEESWKSWLKTQHSEN